MRLQRIAIFLLSLCIIIINLGEANSQSAIQRSRDLEGPDYIQPPQHYRTLEMMLADAGMGSIPKGSPPAGVFGERELLIILVELSDAEPDPLHTNTYYYGRFFNTNPPSVRDYYDEVSYGNFTYIPGNVLGWLDSSYLQSQWVDNKINIFTEAIGNADSYFDFAPYDTNGDGIVSNNELTLFIIVSGVQTGAFHCVTNPSTSISTTDGVDIEIEFSITNEDRHIGSYCHELGHDLGLPDLYDTDIAITGDSAGIGEYGLMGGGSWTFSHMTAWSKIQLGWLKPTIVTSNSSNTLYSAETHACAYILINTDYSKSEYFLIENRYRDASYYETVGPPVAPGGILPDKGIMIYHIDDSKAQDWINNGINNVNADETHKCVDVETAEHPSSHFIDADDLDQDVNRGDYLDLWDNTEYNFNDTSIPCNSNWYNGSLSGIGVSNFSTLGPAMAVTLTVPSFTNTFYVPDDFNKIQDAFNSPLVGPGATIIVKPGTYLENIDFLGKAVILKSSHGPLVTILDGNQSGSVINFMVADGNIEIDGFTILNGTGTNYPSGGNDHYYGGGINGRMINTCSSNIKNNIIKENAAENGAGIYLNGSSGTVKIQDNNIHNNSGSGILINYIINIIISGNVISNNTDSGIKYLHGYYVNIDNNLIKENTTLSTGGGIFGYNSQDEYNTNIYITNNTIHLNYAETSGGGISLSDSNIYLDYILTNNTISMNFSKNGAGIHLNTEGRLHCVNNTIIDCQALYSGGGIKYKGYYSACNIRNTILWGNKANSGDAVYLSGKSYFNISYSDVEGGKGAVEYDPGIVGFTWDNNTVIDSDPLLVDSYHLSWHLTHPSPCRNTGDNSALHLPDTDFEGDPRVGNSTVDMGADEFYSHLYYTGNAAPAGNIQLKFIGIPGATINGLIIGINIYDPPFLCDYGFWYMNNPFQIMTGFGIIPADGVKVLPGTIPASPPAPYTVYLQGVIDMWLTNLCTVNVQ